LSFGPKPRRRGGSLASRSGHRRRANIENHRHRRTMRTQGCPGPDGPHGRLRRSGARKRGAPDRVAACVPRQWDAPARSELHGRDQYRPHGADISRPRLDVRAGRHLSSALKDWASVCRTSRQARHARECWLCLVPCSTCWSDSSVRVSPCAWCRRSGGICRCPDQDEQATPTSRGGCVKVAESFTDLRFNTE
jgi:hypothetical protein